MEIRSRMLEPYKDYQFSIPLDGRERVYVKAGSTISSGDKLFESLSSGSKKSLYLPKILECKVENIPSCMSRIDGEYVEEGEVIARRVRRGGLSILEVLAPVSGILDFRKISKGYIDILGEESSNIFVSDFNGYITAVNPNDGIVVKADALSIDVVATTKEQEKYFGKLEIIEDGNSIITEGVLADDYSGKIVWVGPYLYDRVAYELFERGATAILTYAISYLQFREMGLPIAVVGGFGSVHCDTRFINNLVTLRNRLVILDGYENQLFVIAKSDKKSREWFVKDYINQLVISRAPSTYGYIGKVVDIQGNSGYLYVDFDKKGQSLLHIGVLDFIDL
ncbi:MAG: hypothetical protein ACOX0X_02500 [Candidatus Dojkabacteria bacterium]|jgi:hypothetical protein